MTDFFVTTDWFCHSLITVLLYEHFPVKQVAEKLNNYLKQIKVDESRYEQCEGNPMLLICGENYWENKINYWLRKVNIDTMIWGKPLEAFQ